MLRESCSTVLLLKVLLPQSPVANGMSYPTGNVMARIATSRISERGVQSPHLIVTIGVPFGILLAS